MATLGAPDEMGTTPPALENVTVPGNHRGGWAGGGGGEGGGTMQQNALLGNSHPCMALVEVAWPVRVWWVNGQSMAAALESRSV